MKRDIIGYIPLKSSFLSFEKDIETILKALFVQSQPHSDGLKRLLVLSTRDCLDNTTSEIYNQLFLMVLIYNLLNPNNLNDKLHQK